MNVPTTNAADNNEVKIVFLISLLAALHIFVFTAAFPFFNSVDEPSHFDLVVRYSQGDIPRKLEPISLAAIRYIALFHSPIYVSEPAWLLDGKPPPPPWTQPLEKLLPLINTRETEWRIDLNHEGSMPPLYYVTAGIWWNAGKLVGLDGESILYWLRFLDIIIVGAVVWLSWWTARKIFPEIIFVRLAVPTLIAFMPQSAFYSINSDILLPLIFGAVFFLLLKFFESDTPSCRLACALGFALAGTFLTKTSTLPLLAASALFVAVKIYRLAHGGKIRTAIPALVILLVCAALPMAAWMFWCQTHFGDLTGSAPKIHVLGWTNRPLSEWFSHPLFTPHGLWIFFSGTFSTFWQGEFLWFRQPLAIHALDVLYAVLTMVLLLLALFAMTTRPPSTHRRALFFAFTCLAATLLFYALLSVKFDFHECFYPSRAHPFFTSGRLYLGALVPMMILFASGLDFALQKLPLKIKFAILLTLLGCMVAGEVAVNGRVFSDEYNWYHL